jgi:hypothetical protein
MLVIRGRARRFVDVAGHQKCVGSVSAPSAMPPGCMGDLRCAATGSCFSAEGDGLLLLRAKAGAVVRQPGRSLLVLSGRFASRNRDASFAG